MLQACGIFLFRRVVERDTWALGERTRFPLFCFYGEHQAVNGFRVRREISVTLEGKGETKPGARGAKSGI